MAPWHHVGATMEITLDKNGSLYDPAGTESWNMQIRDETTQYSKLCNIVVGVLSLAPCYVRKKQVQVVDQTTHPPKCHSFVGLDRQIGSSPPALDLKRERTEGRQREKFYIYLDVTHTHTVDFWKWTAMTMWLYMPGRIPESIILDKQVKPGPNH